MKKFLAGIQNQIIDSFREPIAELHPEWTLEQVEREARDCANSLSADDAAAIYAEILRG